MFSETAWEIAHAHVTIMLTQYMALIGMPNVNPFFAISLCKSLLKRYTGGERTQELYDEMMEVE